MTDGQPVPGRFAKSLAYFAAFIALGLALASLGPTMPDLARLTGASLGTLSTIFVARSAGYLVGAVIGGRLFDRIPGHLLLAAMLASMAICLALVPVSRSVLLLAGILFVLGWGEGGLDVGGNTLLVWLYPTGLAPWMNALHFFFGVGALISPLIVTFAIHTYGSFAGAYWLLAALLAPIGLFVAVLPSPPIALHARSRDAPLREHRTNLLFIGGLLFTAVGAEIGFGNWIYTYALRQELADAPGAAILTSTYWSAFTFGRLVGIPLSARFTPATILLFGLLACGVGVLAILTHPESVNALWAGTIVAGFTVGPMFASIVALAESVVPISGRTTGWFLVGSSAGAMTVPWIIGQLFDTVGPHAIWYAMLADICLGLAIYVIFLARRVKLLHRSFAQTEGKP